MENIHSSSSENARHGGGDNNSILSQLAFSVAVQPSSEWLVACTEHLRKTQKPATFPGVLWEILYSDLRDVVRAHSSTPTTNKSPNSDILSQAIHDSRQKQHNYCATLEESFRILVQLEEAVDVAQSRNHSQQSNRNSSSSCCKVCLSDGYGHDCIEGIASLPVRGLAATCPSGCKVLLRGPLQVRHGILVLHSGNCLVLGGCIEALLQHQTKALAKLREGIGVDPTIRALIHSNQDDETEEEDEAHEESGDVVDRTRMAGSSTSHTSARSVPPQEERLSRPPSSSPMAGRKRTVSQISNHQSHSATMNGARSDGSDRQQPQGQPQTSLPSQVRNNTTGNASASRNPYQTTAPTRNIMQETTASNPESSRANAARITPNQGIQNPNNTATVNRSINPYKSSSQQQQQQRNNTRQEPKRRRENPEPNAPGTEASPHFLYSSTAEAPVVPGSSNSKTSVQNMSFANLHKLLLQLVSNREMYESYQDIRFKVLLSVPDKALHDFNVVKAPKPSKLSKSPSKKPKKKYEYFTSTFFGANASPTIACKIHPDLLEPCFSVSANDLRAMNRSDRQKCASITFQGGEAIRKTYYSPRTWIATLYRSAEEVFGGVSAIATNRDSLLRDLKNPILLLQIESS